MGINKSTRPTPSSPVSNPHLILHRDREPPSKEIISSISTW